jgi:DNA polymerase-3 subunit chi
MPEFRFHHLERRRVDQALPELLEAALAEGFRAVVQAGSRAEVEALNERLWTYREDSFLPHGTAGDGDPTSQPVYLTEGEDNPNGATLRVLLAGAEAAALANSAYARVALLFDARDEEAVASARRQWSVIKAGGSALSYWREGDDGGWVKAR